MYDVIIVGARCAGSPLAMLLARAGASVLLVDRATFPSDIPHGHFIHGHGPPRLQRWGLLEKIAAATPAVSTALYDFGDFPLVSRDLVENGVAWGYGPRRTTLDRILVEAAVESGAELRAGFTVDEYIFDGGRVAGIRGRGRNGRQLEERATITVGADGRNSRLARAVQAPRYNDTPPLLFYYFSYWSDVETEEFELYVRPRERRVLFSHKTEDGLFAVFQGFPMEEFAEIRRDIEGVFFATLDMIPGFGERIRAGRRRERFYGASDLPNFYRKPYGPGWALVGDAGLHKDPYMALGVRDAFRDAELLAGAIRQGLGSECPLEEALAGYEKRRNEASGLDFEENIRAARLNPPPELYAVRAALRGDPVQATLFTKARTRMIDPGVFFNPENLGRLMGGSRLAASTSETGA